MACPAHHLGIWTCISHPCVHCAMAIKAELVHSNSGEKGQDSFHPSQRDTSRMVHCKEVLYQTAHFLHGEGEYGRDVPG